MNHARHKNDKLMNDKLMKFQGGVLHLLVLITPSNLTTILGIIV